MYLKIKASTSNVLTLLNLLLFRALNPLQVQFDMQVNFAPVYVVF